MVKRKVVITRNPRTGDWVAQADEIKAEGTTVELALLQLKANVGLAEDRKFLSEYRDEIEVDW